MGCNAGIEIKIRFHRRSITREEKDSLIGGDGEEVGESIRADLRGSKSVISTLLSIHPSTSPSMSHRYTPDKHTSYLHILLFFRAGFLQDGAPFFRYTGSLSLSLSLGAPRYIG